MSRPPTCSATCRRNSACRPTIRSAPFRALTDEALQTMSRRFASLYATTGRPSIPPEQLLRALLLQVLYTVRSERLLMEELNDNLLFRWFVGLNMDDPVWHPTTFTKNRDRLLSGDVAAAFFDAVQAHARAAGLLSDEHFTVDGTQLEAWASLKSFRCVDAAESDPPEDPGNPTVNFHGELVPELKRSRRRPILSSGEPLSLPESHVATAGSKRDVVLGELRTLRRAGGLWLLSFAA